MSSFLLHLLQMALNLLILDHILHLYRTASEPRACGGGRKRKRSENNSDEDLKPSAEADDDCGDTAVAVEESGMASDEQNGNMGSVNI